MNISSVICGDKGPVIKEEHFKERADEAALKNGWLVYLLHGVDNDGGYSPIASETLKASLVYLKNSEGRFWVNTFGNVAKYIKERDGATIKETSVKAKKITLELTDNLDNKTFDYPLTIRRVLPEGWEKVVVSQKGIKVKNSIIEINSVKYIQFDAIPDGGKISLKKILGQ
jgi:oligosaccharide reducing-end xylanase